MMGTGVKESKPQQTEATATRNLRDLFLAKVQCPPQEFEREVLFHCAYSPLLVRLAWRFDPDFFLHDLQLIRAAGMSQSFSDCRHEVEAFRRANPPRGFFRKTLRVRLSGQKLLKLASRLFLSQALPSRTGVKESSSAE
jgi:hypothetical protein